MSLRDFFKPDPLKVLRDTVKNAIAYRNPDAITNALKEIKDKNTFLNKYYDDLMAECIFLGHLPSFNALLAFHNDPNHYLYSTDTILVNHRIPLTVRIYTPLLYFALKNRAHDIALFLANNNRVDVMLGRHGRGEIDPIFKAAEECDMSDVCNVIRIRHSDALLQQAKKLDQQAETLKNRVAESSSCNFRY